MTKKEKVLAFLEKGAEVPLLFEELALMLGVPHEETDELYAILEELSEEALVVRTKKKRYAATSKMGYIRGRFMGTSRGFGFVEREGDTDVFIAADSTEGALNGDIVLAKITNASVREKRAEGVVIRVLTRNQSLWVGRYEESKFGGFVIADDKKQSVDLYIPDGCSLGAKDGDKVVCELTGWEKGARNPEGRVKEVLGNRFEVGVDILSILRAHNIPDRFPSEVQEEARRLSEQGVFATDDRTDFRDRLIITIDGEDAKDLDDAVEAERLANGNFRLGVHIADVGYYVPRNGALDREAFARGTSVYLVDRVIPMLPPELSNGICSLSEGEDRLTLSVIMEIDPSGAVVSHHIKKGVIRSAARMTYREVTAILEGEKSEIKRDETLLLMLHTMQELAALLQKRRTARGSIDFDFPEAKIILDDAGCPVEIQKREQTVSHRIIESFMLCANETIAEEFFFRELPFVFRVHEKPSEDKMEEFLSILKPFGYTIKRTAAGVHPKFLQTLLNEIKDTAEERMISTLLLRSLMKARYSEENLGHFGLAAKYYCHFTSPIRRYPDLVIHRIIGDVLAGKSMDLEELLSFVKRAAEQSSEREIAAMEAERETEDKKKAEYMANHLGEVFEGVVSSVVPFGMFVELYNTVEGLVRIADLDDDYYLYNETQHSLFGKHTNKQYRIGDSVTVCVARANAEEGEIDFVLTENGEDAPRYQRAACSKKQVPAKKRAKQKHLPKQKRQAKSSKKPYMKKKSKRKKRAL